MRVIQKALTFDDVLLVPRHSTVLPAQVDVSTRLTRNIQLGLGLGVLVVNIVAYGIVIRRSMKRTPP